jgi:hypothetical protein
MVMLPPLLALLPKVTLLLPLLLLPLPRPPPLQELRQELLLYELQALLLLLARERSSGNDAAGGHAARLE